MTSEAPQDVAALRELAEKAQEQIDSGHEWDRQHNDALSRLELAASPDVLLGLLDQNDRLRSALERVVRHMEIMDRQADGDGYVVQVTVQTWQRTIRPEITAARDALRGSGAEEAARNG